MQSPAENITRLTITDDLGKNLGPVLMGLATDALLSGVVLNQMVKWAPESGKDWTRVRWLMWSAFAGTVVTTVLTWTWSMHLFVYNFGQYSQFLSWEWSSWYGVLNMLIVMPIRIFFVERAYRISGRSNLLLFAMILCLLGAIVAGVGITATLFPLELLEVNKTSDVFILMCPSVCIAVDLMITVSISWGLYKSKTGWTHTDALIKKLIITTAEANVPGLLIAFAFFLHNMINRKSFFALFFMMVYSKPYIIGMLAVLNSKHEVEKTGTGKSTERSENKYSSRRTDPQQDTVPVSTSSNPFVDYYSGSGTDSRARHVSDAGESVMMDRMGDTDSKTDLTRVERV